MRRPGYTLIELLVAMALIMMIMSILSQAYIKGMDTFSQLKGIGDMSEKLREVTSILRRDLAADHFTGGARISDPNFASNPPREGFFSVVQLQPSSVEGADANGNPSYVATCLPNGAPQDILHFSIKLRGNRQQDFFPGDIPNNTFLNLNQYPDATYSVNGFNYYQWGEVAYYLLPIQDNLGQAYTSAGANNGLGPKPLFALYRAQRAVVSNNAGLPQVSPAQAPHMSISPQGMFNSPSTLENPANRGIFNFTGMPLDALLVSDVLNFDVQVMLATTVSSPNGPVPNFTFTDGNFDSGQLPPGAPGIRAVQIILRVYDLKSRQARQITLVQDL